MWRREISCPPSAPSRPAWDQLPHGAQRLSPPRGRRAARDPARATEPVARFDPRHLWPPERRPGLTSSGSCCRPSARSTSSSSKVPWTRPGAPASCWSLRRPATSRRLRSGRSRSWRQRALTASSSSPTTSRTSSRAARRSPAGRSLPLVAVDRPGSIGLSVEADLEGPDTWPRGISWRTATGRSASSPTKPRSPMSCRSRRGTGAPLPRPAFVPTSATSSGSAPGGSRPGQRQRTA